MSNIKVSAEIAGNQNMQQGAAEDGMPLIIALLGYGGAIPFIFFAVAATLQLSIPFASAEMLLMSYGAVILSFVGALHWGYQLASQEAKAGLYVWSVVPALVAWVALILPYDIAAPIMSVLFVACWLRDRQMVKSGQWPRWMGALRAHLTIAAVGALLLVVFATSWL